MSAELFATITQAQNDFAEIKSVLLDYVETVKRIHGVLLFQQLDCVEEQIALERIIRILMAELEERRRKAGR